MQAKNIERQADGETHRHTHSHTHTQTVRTALTHVGPSGESHGLGPLTPLGPHPALPAPPSPSGRRTGLGIDGDVPLELHVEHREAGVVREEEVLDLQAAAVVVGESVVVHLESL